MPTQQLAFDYKIKSVKINAWQDLDYHSFCLLLPKMSDGELEDLKRDISENGQRDPILLFENQILDGRHRYLAMKDLGITPRFEKFAGNPDSALSYIISKNLKRRNLTSSQRAAIAVESGTLLESLRAEAKERKRGTVKDGEGKESLEAAAEIVGSNPEYLREAEHLRDEDPDLFERVKDGQLNISQARVLRDADDDTREEALEQIDAGDESFAVLKKVKRATRSKKKAPKPASEAPFLVLQAAEKFLESIDVVVAPDNVLEDWRGERAFMYMPLSDPDTFTERWVNFFSEGSGKEGIAMCPMDNRFTWFQAMMDNADAIGLHRGYTYNQDKTNVQPHGFIYFYYGARAMQWCYEWAHIAWTFHTEIDADADDSTAMAEQGLPVESIELLPNESSGRFKVGDRVQVCSSLKPAVIEKHGLPSKTERGVISKVFKSTIDVEWDAHDPAIQRIEKSLICHAGICSQTPKEPKLTKQGFEIGDRVFLSTYPEQVGEVFKVSKTSTQVRFDDQEFGEGIKSIKPIKSITDQNVYLVKNKVLKHV